MNNHPPAVPPQQRSSSTTGDCGECGAHTDTFLFHISVRGNQRRLCTKCVLKLHPSLFCPICFAYYEAKPNHHPSKRVHCSQCTSLTHTHCATPSTSQSPFICSLCSSKTTFNDLSSCKRIDSKSAAMILCAAEIASESMTRAVAVARSEMEKKAKDAALARKKAREALERVALLINKTSQSNKDAGSVVQVSGSESFFNAFAKKENLSQSQDYINTPRL